MLAWTSQLSDANIEVVATHVYSQWSNRGAVDTVEPKRATPKMAAQMLNRHPNRSGPC